MQFRTIGKSGPKVSAIGLVTGQFGASGWGYGTRYDDTGISKVIKAALDMGINLFDTSETYGKGKSETILARVFREYKRDEYVVISKVAPWNLSFSGVLKAIDSSLRRLQINTIDIYLIHYPNPFVRMRDTFRALERLVQEGKIRYIGVSNFSPPLLKRAQECMSKHEIVADEIEYNVLSRRAENDMIPYCLRNGIGVIAYSPLAGGLLSGRYSAEVRPIDRARAYNFLNRKSHLLKIGPLFDLIGAIAENHKASFAQIALAYLLRFEQIVPIPAALTESEARENACAPLLHLTGREIEEIEDLSVPLGIQTYLFDHMIVRPISWAKAALAH